MQSYSSTSLSNNSVFTTLIEIEAVCYPLRFRRITVHEIRHALAQLNIVSSIPSKFCPLSSFPCFFPGWFQPTRYRHVWWQMMRVIYRLYVAGGNQLFIRFNWSISVCIRLTQKVNDQYWLNVLIDSLTYYYCCSNWYINHFYFYQYYWVSCYFF